MSDQGYQNLIRLRLYHHPVLNFEQLHGMQSICQICSHKLDLIRSGERYYEYMTIATALANPNLAFIKCTLAKLD